MPHHRNNFNAHSPQKSHINNSNSSELQKCLKLFHGSSDPILILGTDGQIIFANHSAEKFFHFSSYKTRPPVLKNCLLAESAQKVLNAIRKVRRETSQYRLELNAVDGHKQSMTLEGTLYPLIVKGSIPGFVLSLRDISQERQVEELIRESQKMEAMQYFVAGTSKELQHPLWAILKRIETVEKKYRGRSFEYFSYKEFNQILDFMDSIRKQIKSCYDTTVKLTHLNKKRLKFESHYCQANTVIREIARLKDQSFSTANISVKLRLAEHLPDIRIGELELNQILTHLIENAVQAMPGGGQLTVQSKELPENHLVRIEIMDDGIGISPENLPHIFEPFFTTKQKSIDRSAGLGLSIVYSLIRACHGQIQVKSSLRKGTTVILTVPIV